MRTQFKYLFGIAALYLIGCQDFVRSEKVIGNYYLVAIDIEEDLSLSYKLESGDFIGVVGGTLLAIGYDENYILAKQSPGNRQSVINYYIVPIYEEVTLSPEKGLMGPFTLEEFNNKRRDLNISNDVILLKK